MAIKALTKIIFKRIRGRIVPIRTKLDPSVRKEVKRAIAQRTSTSMKRIKAIRAVRLTLQGKTKKIGEGAAVNVYGAGQKVVKVGKDKFFGGNRFMDLRFIKKNMLGKKIAPETMLVKTKRKSYVVEQRGENAHVFKDMLLARGKVHKAESISRSITILKQRSLQKELVPNDLHEANAIYRKGKVLIADADSFFVTKNRSIDDVDKMLKKYRKNVIEVKK